MHETPPSTMVLRYFLLLFLIAILMMGRILWPFLSILILSYLLTSIFQPLYAFFNRLLPPTLASLLTCLLVVLLVFIPLVFFVISLSQEAFHLYEWGRGAGANLAAKLQAFQETPLFGRVREVAATFGVSLDPESISRFLAGLARKMGLFLYNQASSWAANLLQFIFSFFIMILTIFFLLIDHDRLLNYILRLSPLPDDQERRLFTKFDEIAGAVLIGNAISGVIQGVIGGLIFAFFNLGSPVLWGSLMAVLAFLPIFGIGLVMVPAALVMVFKGSLAGGLVIFGIYVLITIFMEYMLKPKMVGSQVKMHTLLVFLSIMGGLSTFGVLGIIYGPLIITAFLTLADIYLASYDKYVKLAKAD